MSIAVVMGFSCYGIPEVVVNIDNVSNGIFTDIGNSIAKNVAIKGRLDTKPYLLMATVTEIVTENTMVMPYK